MRKWFYWILLYALLTAQCAKEAPKSGKLLVGVSIQPLADLTKKIGGSKIDVFTIVPPGANPHTFELTPGIMKKMARADLLVFNGVGLEFWLDNVMSALRGKKATFTAEGLEILQGDDEHYAHGNPHVWLDPRNAQYQCRKIFAALADVDPANRSYYETQTAILLKELEILDSDIRQQVAAWKQKRFVCFHPSWEYFARRYGLEQAAVIEKRPGQEQSPQEVVDLIAKVKEIGARAVFAETGFPTRTADVIARESGIRVILLDPLGVSPQTCVYVDLMRYNVAQMAKAMRE